MHGLERRLRRIVALLIAAATGSISSPSTCIEHNAESNTVCLSGTVCDVLTAEGIENCHIVVGEDSTRPDPSGSYEVRLPASAYVFSVRSLDKEYYTYSTLLHLREDTHLDVPMIPRSVDVRFLKSFFPNDVIIRWENLPIKVYYNRPDAPAGYIHMLEGAIGDWEFVSAMNLFEEVQTPEEADLDPGTFSAKNRTPIRLSLTNWAMHWDYRTRHTRSRSWLRLTWASGR
ncbi:hypothetical protein AMJ40_07605 [candidate division TA06 bacterium DG_26]|uniref:Uncharacterized protein n=1 Tax=candidate division TA06 bacterium DG_26 TaxID=1703771 RepID=A0A0S7WE22_UNCT6|nr:MAG: hypothetical protein AMJ40_07605 [candidate division TA06 bacterium DG_26]